MLVSLQAKLHLWFDYIHFAFDRLYGAMTTELLDLAQDVVSRAKRLGASSADALAITSDNIEISVRHGVVDKLERAELREVGIRVFVGQASAMVCGSAADSGALERLVERCVAMAKLAPADPYAGIATPDLFAGDAPALDLVSDEQHSADWLKALAIDAENAALSVAGVAQISSADASSSRRDVALVTSNGFARFYGRTGVGFSVSPIAGEGAGMERDYDYTSACHASDLESAETIGINAGNRAVRRLNPRKVSSQSVPVIYDRRVATSLIGHLLSGINGSAIARGTSFLREDMGKALFAPSVTIIDDPLRVRGSGSRPFDGEGLAVHRRSLIDQGVLTQWLLDLSAARQLNLAPTGNGSRGLASPPSPTSSNVHMAAGTVPLGDMIASISQGLLVTELIGNGGNMITGDYSRGASGFWIENGEVAYPVSEITIAGNLRDMFAKLTPADDLIFKGSTNAPSCLVEGLTLAGR
jgi:PmbA protein